MQSTTHGAHWPLALHVCPAGQAPHDPPQPLGPQARPLQAGTHETHCPLELHVWPVGHVPHDPPQPLSPQVRPVQLGVQLVQKPMKQIPLPQHSLDPGLHSELSGAQQRPPEQTEKSPQHSAVFPHAPPIGLQQRPLVQVPPQQSALTAHEAPSPAQHVPDTQVPLQQSAPAVHPTPLPLQQKPLGHSRLPQQSVPVAQATPRLRQQAAFSHDIPGQQSGVAAHGASGPVHAHLPPVHTYEQQSPATAQVAPATPQPWHSPFTHRRPVVPQSCELLHPTQVPLRQASWPQSDWRVQFAHWPVASQIRP